MRLYHGSTQAIERPNAHHSRKNLDFGQGFYLTSYFDQAAKWARRKALIGKSRAIVNEYELDEDLSDMNVLRFGATDAAWVEFVCDCRRGGTAWRDYDLIVGGVANDKVYFAVDMYYQGIWDMDRTLEALRFYKVNDQWCFVSQSALDAKVRFVGWREL